MVACLEGAPTGGKHENFVCLEHETTGYDVVETVGGVGGACYVPWNLPLLLML
jgi:hypothetical protein